MATRFSAFASAAVVIVAAACTSSHHDKPCPRNQPAFRIQLTASDGTLPADTELTVTYSGIEMESYSLARGGPRNQDVCCRPASPTDGALSDVPCGIPPAPRDASVTTSPRDAATKRDAAQVHDAATIHDAGSPSSMHPDAALAGDGSARVPSDASSLVSVDATVADATPASTHDASADDAAAPRSDGAAPGATGPQAIVCDLWTNGVATVVVTGTGYAKLDKVLDDPFVPDPRCGVQTVDHRITLTHGDGGLLR